MPKKTTRTSPSTEAPSPAAPRRRTTTAAAKTTATPASVRLKKAVAHDRASSAAPVVAPADTAQTVPASPAKPRARAKQPAATARRRVAVAGSASAAQASAAAVEVTAPQDLASACATPAVAEPTHDEIATRAYFIYLRRGTPGNPDQDWQQAVWELRQERALA